MKYIKNLILLFILFIPVFVNGLTSTEAINDTNSIVETYGANEVERSSNSNLKSLSILGYEIDFSSDKHKYEILVSDKVNSITVNYEVEDANATVELIGANNLKENNDEVTLIVTAQDLSKSEYTIFVNRKNEEEKVIVKERFNIKKIYKTVKSKLYDNKRNKIILSVLLLSILVLSVLIIITNKINNKKIDTQFDKL